MTQRRTHGGFHRSSIQASRNRGATHGGGGARARAAVERLEARQLLAADLVSVAAGGNAGDQVSAAPSVSADGRFVAFVSRATNLIAGLADTNDAADVFLRDRATGVTQLVSRNVTGERPGNDSSGADNSVPSVSADGRFVTFQSEATDLVDRSTNDAPNTPDVFVRDMQTGVTRLISATNNGDDIAAGGERPVISADGRFVAFHSRSLALAPSVPRTTDSSQVFVKDLTSGALTVASVNAGGSAAGNGTSAFASISGDGRYVAFASEATNLAAEDVLSNADIYVRDLQAGTTALASLDRQNDGPGNAASLAPAISADGRFVAFESAATDLVAGHTGSQVDVFVRNLAAKTTSLVSVNRLGTSAGAGGNGDSGRASISPDGRFVAFASAATNLTEAASDIGQYVRDTAGNVTYAAQLNPGGAADDVGSTAALTANGRLAVAATGAAVAADRNGAADVYLLDVVPATVDTAAPAATVPAAQPGRSKGSRTIDFDIAYADATGVREDTVGEGDLRVTLPDGSTQIAKFVTKTGTGTNITGKYRIDAPGGSLGPEDNGSYAVALLAGAVADSVGNATLPAAVGSFPVALGGGTGGAGVDLVPTVTLVAPPAVAGGTGVGRVTVRVANTGDAALGDTVRITLYASTDTTVDAGDTTLLNVDKRLRVKADGFRNLKAAVVFPASLAQGSYFVLAALDEPNSVPEENDFNNVAASSTSVVVAPPFVDLTGSFPKSPSGNLARGQSVPLALLLQNAGNVPAAGNLSIKLVISANGQSDPTDPVLGTLTKKVNLKPGAAKALKLKMKVPSSLIQGTYRIMATFDTQGTINESNVLNNAVSTTAFQVS